MKLKNKKVIGLFLCFAVALCVVVPGTLAAKADTDVTYYPISIGEIADQSQDNLETPVDIETSSDAEKVCTCDANEDGILTCAEGCPVHEVPAHDEPEAPKHIEGCSDECNGVDCECECHKLSLFDRLMKCETYAEIMKMIEATPEEELMTLTSEQVAQVEKKIQALEPQPLPEIIIEETNDKPIISEIIYPTVNFDIVAPFGDPVVG